MKRKLSAMTIVNEFTMCFEYYNVLLLGGFCFFETFLHLFIYNWIVKTWTTFCCGQSLPRYVICGQICTLVWSMTTVWYPT